jgi:RNA polymerase sigma-70 factor (ECF subfamily)
VSDDHSFQELMTRLRAGDEAVAARIFKQYARRLVGLARQRLTQDVRANVDPEDVVQSALRTFIVHQGEGQYYFGGWHDLWNLLAAFTVRKCGGRIDYYRSARRDATREAAPPADSAALWEPLAREPTPSEALMLLEVTDNVLRGLGERDSAIFEQTLHGERPLHISERLGCSERTVERVLEHIRKQLESGTDE